MEPKQIEAEFNALRENLYKTMGEPLTEYHKIVLNSGLDLLEGFLKNIAIIAKNVQGT